MKKFILAIVAATLSLSAASLSDIKAKGEIRIGVRNSLPPFSEKKDGLFEGFEVELAKKLAENIIPSGKITFVGLEAKDRVSMLENDEVDVVIASFSATPERRQRVDFSIPYFTEYMGIAVLADSTLKNALEFENKRLLVVPGTTSSEFIDKNKDKFTNTTIVPCENFMNCYDKLKTGEADGYFHSAFSLAIVPIIDPGFKMVIDSSNESSSFIAVGVQKGNKDLLNLINSSIIELSKSSFFKDAYDNTFNIFYKGTLDKKYFLLDDFYKSFM